MPWQKDKVNRKLDFLEVVHLEVKVAGGKISHSFLNSSVFL